MVRKSVLRLGFTLLELLIVMAVLGTLAAIVVNTFPRATKAARDSTRRSDLRQYQTAMETYYNKSNAYIFKNPAVKPSTMCGAAQLNLTACPNDPKDGVSVCSSGTCQYQYITNATTSLYSFWTRLEAPAVATSFWFIVCSDGRNYESATAPTFANPCP